MDLQNTWLGIIRNLIFRTLREYNLYTVSDNILNLKLIEILHYTSVIYDQKNFPKIFHINHHLSHAAIALSLKL